MFFALACRLPAYTGVLAARLAAEDRPAAARAQAQEYEASSPLAGNAATRRADPPATAAALAGLNAQMGGKWFTHTVVPRD